MITEDRTPEDAGDGERGRAPSMVRSVKRECVARLIPILVLLFSGCASAVVSYMHPDVDLGHIQRCAVLPFQNLSADELAGERLQSVFLMELLSARALEIVGPGETAAAMQTLRLDSGAALTPEQAVSLGKALSVDGLFFGVVEDYGISKVDRARSTEVTAVFGLTETETGALVWRSQVHASGVSIWRRLFGGGSAGLHDVSRQAVRRALRSLP
jgi:hypothetical protein